MQTTKTSVNVGDDCSQDPNNCPTGTVCQSVSNVCKPTDTPCADPNPVRTRERQIATRVLAILLFPKRILQIPNIFFSFF